MNINDKEGWVKLHRKLLNSRVFQNANLLKVFIWCLLKANHKGKWVAIKTGRGTTEVYVGPGQFIFGRKKAAEELKMKPTSVHDRVKKLANLQILVIQPGTHYSLVIIVNWGLYQDREIKSDTKPDNQPTTNRQPTDTNKNVKNVKKETPDFFSLKSRYQNPDLIDQAFKDIASTRKGGKVAESILLAQLQKWERYPIEHVETCIRIYLDKDCAG